MQEQHVLLIKTNLSLPSIFGLLGSIFISEKYKAVSISVADKEPPGCPDFASAIIETIDLLISLAFSF